MYNASFSFFIFRFGTTKHCSSLPSVYTYLSSSSPLWPSQSSALILSSFYMHYLIHSHDLDEQLYSFEDRW